MPALTLSGNEITDQQRTAALLWSILQQGGSTDGAAEPGGTAVWEPGTNLFRRGQCDATTDWSADNGVARSIDAATAAPFSPQSMKVVANGANAGQGVHADTATGQAAAAGTNAAGSIYFKGTAGQSYAMQVAWQNTDATFTTLPSTTFVATGGWQLLIPTPVAVAAGKTGDKIEIAVRTSTARADTFWLAHAMLQKGVGCVSPYVATSQGATATRSAARTQAPSSLLNPAQGWAAIRLRMGFASTASLTAGNDAAWLLNLRDDATHRLELYWQAGTQKWSIGRVSPTGGADFGIVDPLGGFAAGDTRTVVFAWDAGHLYISVNGGAFTSFANTFVPTIAAALFDIGSQFAGSYADSEILWFAAGTGTLTDADAATLNALGNSAPIFASTLGRAAQTSMVWDAQGSYYDPNPVPVATKTRQSFTPATVTVTSSPPNAAKTRASYVPAVTIAASTATSTATRGAFAPSVSVVWPPVLTPFPARVTLVAFAPAFARGSGRATSSISPSRATGQISDTHATGSIDRSGMTATITKR